MGHVRIFVIFSKDTMPNVRFDCGQFDFDCIRNLFQLYVSEWVSHKKVPTLHNTTLSIVHIIMWLRIVNGYLYSYPDMVNSLCIKCHAACLSCIGPVNNPTNCTSCASGYWSSSNIGPCSNCFQGCKTCNGLTATSCLSCSGTYFFLSINNSCVTSCPPLYYSSESLNLCISCDVTCLTCDGSGSNYCTSCQSGRYLDGTQCITLCLTPLMGFTVNNTCVSQCPYTNFIQTSDNTCRPCPTNCGVCVNTSYCVTCINNGIFYNNLCVTSCAGSTFSDGSSCQPCHSTCLTCSSNAFPNLDST